MRRRAIDIGRAVRIAAGAAVLALAPACTWLGPPVQHAFTGETIVRTTEPTSLAAVAGIAWGDTTLASAVATLTGLPAGEPVPGGTVLVLPPRDRLETVLRSGDGAPAPLAADTTPAAAAPKREALSASDRRDLDALYARGNAAVKEGRIDDALRDWETVWRRKPDYPGVAERLEQEYRVRGLEAFSDDRLDDAVALWKKALAVDPTDETTLGYLARAREQQARSDEILGNGAAQ